LSFTVFLALNSPEFCNKYIRDVPYDVGVLPLGGYLKFWAVMYLLVTAWLIFFEHEEAPKPHEDMGVLPVYRTIVNIVRLPHMYKFILVLLSSKIGFIANEAVTGLKLLEKGLSKEDLALAVLIDFPFQLLFGYYAAKWSSGKRPLRPWLYGFYGRLFFAAVGMVVVSAYPSDGVTNSYFALVMTLTVLNSFTRWMPMSIICWILRPGWHVSTVQFVSMGAFFNGIADPVIGGTYMTLLNTFSNFGGTWPRFFVLEAVDYLTDAECSVPLPGGEGTRPRVIGRRPCGRLVDTFMAGVLVLYCNTQGGKQRCSELAGDCNVLRDGYYTVGVFCVSLGTLLLFTFIRPQIKKAESGFSARLGLLERDLCLSPKLWRLPHSKAIG
ncbi:MAG: YBR220Cp-like protein, partial [Olpidium bornovanus]